MLAFKLAMMLCITLMTVTTKLGRRGEHEGNRKAIAQGMPVETGEPVEDYRILCGPRVHQTPGIPCVSSFRGGVYSQTSGAVRRENEEACPSS
jgi:hypothetical protein